VSEKPVCLFCGSEAFYKFNIDRFSPAFDVWQCSGCGLMFQHPFPEKIESLYEEGYYSGESQFSYEDERKTFSFHAKVWKARIQKLEKYIGTENIPNKSKINLLHFFKKFFKKLFFKRNIQNRPDISKTFWNKRILDIGCSFGGLLRTAQSLGWKGYGVEISDFSREHANRFLEGRVFKDFGEAEFKENTFDAVTMIELIEHLENPVEILKKSYEILKKNGILLIQTANMEGRQAKKGGSNYHYFLPGHLFYFSKKNLIKKLKEVGFSKVKVFHPVEFGLLPKLLKSRGSFRSWKDYFRWFKITFYHWKGLIRTKNFALTSSMVIYTWK
jgi:2-polyprenyl-3-methyl-5-hydroxy-6-metoxy-1,4-benzoquinol methylase